MSILSKPERFCLGLLTENKSLDEIHQAVLDKFKGKRVPTEYLQILKRLPLLRAERRTTDHEKKEQSWQTRNWRDQYLTGKAKRH